MLRDTMSCDLESRLKDLEAVLNSDQGRHLGVQLRFSNSTLSSLATLHNKRM